MKNITTTLLSIFLITINVNAQTLDWARGFGGTAYSHGQNVSIDASGNVYTTGIFSGTIDLDPGSGTDMQTAVGSDNVFIQKLDANGNLLWAKSYGDSGNVILYSNVIDNVGNLLISGRFGGAVDFDPNAGTAILTNNGAGAFIQKLDPNGNLIWAKGYGRNAAFSIAVDASNNVYTTGNFNTNVDFDPNAGTAMLEEVGFQDAYILKLDSNGNFVWVKGIGGISSLADSRTITIDDLGNVYVSGFYRGTVDFDPNSGVQNYTESTNSSYLLKLNNSGDFVWMKSFTDLVDDHTAVTTDNAHNVYLTGNFQGTVDFDPNAGTEIITATNSQIFICKLDFNGNYVWAKSMKGSAAEHRSTAVDASGNVYTGGSFTGTVDFDPNAGITNLTSIGYNGFVQKLDAAGDLIWVIPAGTSLNTASQYDMNELKIDANGNIYATGGFRGTLDFNPSVSIVNNLVSNGVYADAFVQKLVPTVLGVENQEQAFFKLYPNPSTGIFQIELLDGNNDAKMQVIDNVGKTVYETSLNNSKTTVDLRHLPAGMYHITTTLASGASKQDKIILN